MKLAKTIRLDISDTNIFPKAADPGEWAIAGTFSFVDTAYTDLDNKQKIAFKSGWLGLASLGRSTLVCVTGISDREYHTIIRQLAEYLLREFNAPDIHVAEQAARQQIDDMVSLCNHPSGTLLAIGREAQDAGIAERVRKIANPNDENHARIWELEADED